MQTEVLEVKQPKNNKRAAGILMHITSLPSKFGIGDIGPEAKVFVDFLKDCSQKYWQILPLNPTENGQGHSPYSSICSRAGNPLLISPELLVADGLLKQEALNKHHQPQGDKVNYTEAEKVKATLFDEAWKAYNTVKGHALKPLFNDFCKHEAEWLDDFALYMVLKKKNNGQAWFQWPEKYKLRDKGALEQAEKSNKDEIQKTKWLQFLFMKQWKELKTYCNDLNIRLFGDLPFYISYDSVDVWSNPEIFCIDDKGRMLGVAGVPPDGFSADGQLWGMPVFKWDVLKKQGYKWWIHRLEKNAELFDLLRLDHFRAFADYWEVPAGEKTARKGTWKPGPGAYFFDVVKKKLNNFELIAEDLGEINDPVYELRDKFEMPGMKVLQFAFGGDMPQSNYIPHNYSENFIVYTGTHDNNTTKGWYTKDANDSMREKIDQYAGMQVTAENVHDVFTRMAYGSVAKIAIIPVQDILGLGEDARMNIPASGENNWAWRLLPGQLNSRAADHLRFLVSLYNRK